MGARHLAVVVATGACLISAPSSTAAGGATALERSWLGQLHAGKRPEVATSKAAVSLASRIVSDLRSRYTSSIEVTIYRATAVSPGSLAPDIRVQAVNAGSFLRHRLGRVLPLVGRHAYVYIRVSDRRGVAFEWDQSLGRHTLRLRPDVAGCSPIWNLTTKQPPCRAP